MTSSNLFMAASVIAGHSDGKMIFARSETKFDGFPVAGLKPSFWQLNSVAT